MALSVELGAFAKGPLLLLRLLFSPFLAWRRSGGVLGGGSRSLFDSPPRKIPRGETTAAGYQWLGDP